MKILNFIFKHKLLVLILMIGAILRFYKLNFQSVWVDEIFTMNVSNPKLTSKEFHFEMLLREGFPYLYFYILHFFYALFGYAVVTARAVSVLGGLLGIWSIYLLGKELYNREAGLVAALLVAVNEYNIYISQDARPYSIYFFAVIFSFYRLSIFIRDPRLKNSIWYGLSAALLLNINFFAFVNLLSHAIIISCFLVLHPRQDKISLFKHGMLAGFIAILLFLPNYKMLEKLLSWKSFWVPPPGPESFSLLFREFLGNSEMTMFIVAPLFVYYLFTVFRQEEANFSLGSLKSNQLQYCSLILFVWAFVFTSYIMIKSYTDISLMLARYFTSLTPVILLIIAIAIALIKNRLFRAITTGTLVCFILINLFVVKDYYNRVTKTQFREITSEIILKNKNNDKVVSSWGYLYNYFLKEKTGKNTIERPLDQYVKDMMAERVDNHSFWYTDGNSRPYKLEPELEDYLNQNFTVAENIEYHDTWARYYKTKHKTSDVTYLTLPKFQPSMFDGSGDMIFVSNTISKYPPLHLSKGKYSIKIAGFSLPEIPLNGVNAHFKIIINGKVVGDFYLDNNPVNQGKVVQFNHPNDGPARFQIEYDNDEVVGNIDRNAKIQSIQIKKM